MNDISSSPIELIDTGAVVAKYQPAERTDLLVVSFHHVTRRSRAIWGGDFFSKHGISVIGITDYKMAWYPRRDMAAIIPHILPLLPRYKQSVSYGHSMGGYAALKYGRDLNIDLALAFSPQHSIEPADVRKFDKGRADLYYRESLHRGMKITEDDLPRRSLVFLDWHFRVDRRHAVRLPQVPTVSFIACPFAKHQPVEMLSKAGATKLLFHLVRTGRTDWQIMRSLVRKARRHSPLYQENLDAYVKERLGEVTIEDLIQGLEAAKEPSLLLDRQIALTMGYRLKMLPNGRTYWESPAGEQLIECPNFTGSVDKAKQLAYSIAPHHIAGFISMGNQSCAQINEAPVSRAATAPLAICLAVIRLKQYRDRRRRAKAAVRSLRQSEPNAT